MRSPWAGIVRRSRARARRSRSRRCGSGRDGWWVDCVCSVSSAAIGWRSSVATAIATSRSTKRSRGPGYVLVPLNQRHTVAELRYALADSGTRVLFLHGDGAPFADVVEHVIDLDHAYEQLLDFRAAGGLPDRRVRERSGRVVLHRRHDGRRQGRDADAPQPDRQHLPLPDLLCVRRRHAVAGRGTDVPCRRVGRRARHRVARSVAGGSGRLRPGGDARPDRARAGDGDARRTDDVGGDQRGAAGASARRVVAGDGQPRRIARRHRDPAAGARCLPRRPTAASLRGDRDGADRDRAAARGADPRHAAGTIVRTAGGRRRDRRDRRRRRGAARAERSARSRYGAPT